MRLYSLSAFKLVFILLLGMVCLSLMAHHYLSNMANFDTQPPSHKTRRIDSYADDPDPNSRSLSAYQHEIEELRHIKASVNNELRDLENRRLKLQSDINAYSMNIDSLKGQHVSLNKEVNQIKLALEQLKFEQQESKSFIPNIKAPHRILLDVDVNEQVSMPSSSQQCYMENCFDFSRCSLVSGFPVYFYNLKNSLAGQDLIPFLRKYVRENVYATDSAAAACIFILIVGDTADDASPDPKEIESFLHRLPYWNGDGRNHILINLALKMKSSDIFSNINLGRAIVAQSAFLGSKFRNSFDVLIPPNLGPYNNQNIWQDLPLLSPVRRKYMLSYWGQFIPPGSDNLSANNADATEVKGYVNNMFIHRKPLYVVDTSTSVYSHIEQAIISSLKSFQSSLVSNYFVDVSCGEHGVAVGGPGDWALCGTEAVRKEKIIQSTFTLIISPLNNALYSTLAFQSRVYEALKHGSVPVILGSLGQLPFSEVLRWDLAAIVLPMPRVTEIPFYLQSFPDEQIAALRLQGRVFFQNYLSSLQSIFDTLLAEVRTRLQIPAHPIRDEPSISVFPASFIPLKYQGPDMEPESDELLGPVESPFPSETYRYNFSHTMQINAFNVRGDPFHLYPHTPFEPWLPSEAKFLGSNYGFRPVGRGAGGDGKEFGEALGGNSPREQFTIVMLTYDREVVLIQALHRFKGLPFLNKVIVVWNGENPPSSDLRWPEIGVPVEVVKTGKNSLNNRFLPFDVIETEAILSIDDDAHLRHDEIVFGFRVWREERTRIVGFPGRFHAWDVKHQSWNYNSNYSCELSMVLTGAAFFHKYYTYLYSYVMPQAIRDKVDEYLNCEDIAMNFLVSHITRKPPIKVTSRWTFRCPGCPTTLSSNSSHFEERHQCINFFTQVYGYTPLYYTQYRVDSVLFKTRIAHDKMKCFKYI
ncbi:exostosin-like 3 [Biomphalaria glabrata]|uniref:glucuronosyl-galactosyl-proteoglycan 4-alpha-N-acetylglucosaminyltransferase n=1 Tax=Biomphalaria glabrata TaxID=6526 RepID=A0A9W2Z9E7_BIOGL|nr:exostosin-like 3 [Biomphalaria glabrata]